MYLATIDGKREVLHLVFAGRVTVEEARSCREEVTALAATLKPGFRLLTDLCALGEMDYACSDEIRAVMDELARRGLSEIVRIIPDQKRDIGFMVMSYFHYGKGVKIHTVDSLGEALKLLQS